MDLITDGSVVEWYPESSIIVSSYPEKEIMENDIEHTKLFDQ